MKHNHKKQATVESTKFNPFLGGLVVLFGICLGSFLRGLYNCWQLQNPFVDTELVFSGLGFTFLLLLILFLTISQSKK